MRRNAAQHAAELTPPSRPFWEHQLSLLRSPPPSPEWEAGQLSRELTASMTLYRLRLGDQSL